jgi:DNA-binding transcriptional LysR family regulator
MNDMPPCVLGMTFAQLRALLAVVDEGGFTAAAARLGMAQPAVSRALLALEAELGGPLLVRGREGVTATGAGLRAIAHAREVVRHHDLLAAEVAAAMGEVTGALTVASFPSATARLIPPLLRAFAARHPRVQARLFEGSDPEVLEWLAGGAAEVGVVTLPCPAFETVALAADEMVAVLPPGHRLQGAASVTLRDLREDPFILSTGGCEPLIAAAAREARVALQIAFEARETSTILAMVAAGLGVSLVPTLSLPPGASPVAVRPLDPAVTRSLALAVRSRAAASPAARAFLELSEGASI